MKWTWDDGKDRTPTQRSDLPCPNVIRDGLDQPLQHQADGRWYDSKRAMEKADKDAGCVCIGNESITPVQPSPPPGVEESVGRAYQKLEQGYKPSVKEEAVGSRESGWV